MNTVASVFYYLRWIAPAMRSAPEFPAPDRPATVTAYLAAPASIAIGLLAGPALAGLLPAI